MRWWPSTRTPPGAWTRSGPRRCTVVGPELEDQAAEGGHGESVDWLCVVVLPGGEEMKGRGSRPRRPPPPRPHGPRLRWVSGFSPPRCRLPSPLRRRSTVTPPRRSLRGRAADDVPGMGEDGGRARRDQERNLPRGASGRALRPLGRAQRFLPKLPNRPDRLLETGRRDRASAAGRDRSARPSDDAASPHTPPCGASGDRHERPARGARRRPTGRLARSARTAPLVAIDQPVVGVQRRGDQIPSET